MSAVRTILILALAVCATYGGVAVASSAEPISIVHPWARATPKGATTAAIYMTVTTTEPKGDRLIGAATPAAQEAQVHATSVANGIMSMRAVPDGLAVSPGAPATLKPGGYHLMLTGLKRRLKAGESIALTLDFAKAGRISLKVPVLPIGSTGASAMGAMGSMMK